MSAPDPSPTLDRVGARLPVLVAFSGAAALVYESQWMRSFGLIFGNTTDAVTWVLVVFMGGLALGSAIAARRASADPLRAYAHVELGVAGAALATLPLLRALPWAYGGLSGRLGLEAPLELLGRVVLAAVVLLPATVLLGATVPLAVEVLVRAGRPLHASFGRLYLLNTLGGAVGVALGPFVLVPVLGVSGAVLAAATVSLVVGGVAWRWRVETGPPLAGDARSTSPEEGSREAFGEPPDGRGGGPRIAEVGPALAAVTGVATFGVEVLWTRSYALVIGSSVHAFNLMLLAVLLGLVGGTFLYGRLRERIRRPSATAGLAVAAGGVAVLAGEWAIGRLPPAYLAALRVVPVSFAAQQLAGLLLCLVTMLPLTLLLGLTFPLLTHLPGAAGRPAQVASGRLYAWNTAGAIGGALVADLLLVPRLGLQRSYLVFAALLLAGGAAAIITRAGPPRPVAWLAPIGLAFGLLALVPAWQPWDPVLMTSGVYQYGLEWREEPASPWELGRWLRERRTQLFYREGAEAVVGVSQTRTGRRFLSVNGKTDAGSGVEDVATQRFIAHVPMLLHPSPRRALVIGWGAGATAASVALYPLDSLECVEIEPATWEAAPLFGSLSGSLRDDPRFHIVFRDGRNHLLRAARTRWDVIVSEPSNPWISGVSNLFTLEFYEIVRGRLAPGGVFGQWFHYYNLAPADVKVEVKTFLTVFPSASLWLVPPVESADGTRRLGADLLLVGSDGPQSLDWTRLVHALNETAVGDDLRSTRVLADPLALVAAWTMGRQEMVRWVEDEGVFAGGTPLNTDDHPYVELVAPRRNVKTPAAAAREASEQYVAMGRAAGAASSVLRGHPGSGGGGEAAALLLRQLAERHLEAEQPDRALAALDAATEAEPGDAAARTRAGELLVERGREIEAMDRLRSAVRVDPDDVKAWDLLGQIAIDRRDYALAEAAHRAMLRREPSNVTAWLRLAAVLARQGRWGEAEEALGWARQLDRNAPIDPQLERYIAGRARAERKMSGR